MRRRVRVVCGGGWEWAIGERVGDESAADQEQGGAGEDEEQDEEHAAPAAATIPSQIDGTERPRFRCPFGERTHGKVWEREGGGWG